MYIVIIFILILIIYKLFYFVKIHKNFKKRNLDTNYYLNIIINFIISSVIVIVILFLNNIFLKNNMPSLTKIILYLIVVDTLYYWYHRIVHRIPILKQFLHITHHNNFNLLPP